MKKHSLGVLDWAKTWKSWMIWTYNDAVKISYQMDLPKWYFLHNYPLCPETWNNIGEKMDC